MPSDSPHQRSANQRHVPDWLPAGLHPLPPTLLACQVLPHPDPRHAAALCGAGYDPARHLALGLVTVDQDDSTYAALDHATKFADVDVVYARSFYAGSAHSSGPLSGEILGVLAGKTPDDVAEALAAFRQYLSQDAHFYAVPGPSPQPALFPHVIAEVGTYLAGMAGIAPGSPLAYLIAPPLEAMVAVDAALKAADVTLCKHYGPPTETNYGGAWLTGSLAEVQAAAAAFAAAVVAVARQPLAAARRLERQRG
jgi:ethanolamine utilization protein EutL